MWYIYYETPRYMKRKMSILLQGNLRGEREYVVVFPNKEFMLIRGLKRFCEAHNLITSCMRAVSGRKQNHHKGYKCYRV